jgi:hypothetical protein
MHHPLDLSDPPHVHLEFCASDPTTSHENPATGYEPDHASPLDRPLNKAHPGNRTISPRRRPFPPAEDRYPELQAEKGRPADHPPRLLRPDWPDATPDPPRARARGGDAMRWQVRSGRSEWVGGEGDSQSQRREGGYRPTTEAHRCFFTAGRSNQRLPARSGWEPKPRGLVSSAARIVPEREGWDQKKTRLSSGVCVGLRPVAGRRSGFALGPG